MNQSFTNFLATLITVFILITWFIPAYIVYHGFNGLWGILYLPIFIVTLMWGDILRDKYFK
jgi:hypothetical protein